MSDSRQLRAVLVLPALDEACRRLEQLLGLLPADPRRATVRDVLRALLWAGVTASTPMALLAREAHTAAQEGARARLGSAAPLPTAAELRRALGERVVSAPAEELRAMARALGLPLADG